MQKGSGIIQQIQIPRPFTTRKYIYTVMWHVHCFDSFILLDYCTFFRCTSLCLSWSVSFYRCPFGNTNMVLILFIALVFRCWFFFVHKKKTNEWIHERDREKLKNAHKIHFVKRCRKINLYLPSEWGKKKLRMKKKNGAKEMQKINNGGKIHSSSRLQNAKWSRWSVPWAQLVVWLKSTKSAHLTLTYFGGY